MGIILRHAHFCTAVAVTSVCVCSSALQGHAERKRAGLLKWFLWRKSDRSYYGFRALGPPGAWAPRS